MTQKTTSEIKTLLSNAQLDFDFVENKALNAYLPKIFYSLNATLSFEGYLSIKNYILLTYSNLQGCIA